MNATVRGACPSIAAPMQTGDGLLVRLIPVEPLEIDKLCILCTAAEEYGNGIIEITQRGSLQIRGLQEASVSAFARAVESLEIGLGEGPPLVTSPLLGLDPEEPFDCTALVSSVRTALQQVRRNQEALSPKVSVLIDGGGQLHLDAVSADIRLVASSCAGIRPLGVGPGHCAAQSLLRASPGCPSMDTRAPHAAHPSRDRPGVACDAPFDSLLQVSLAGNAHNATHLGYVPIDRATATLKELLRRIASQGVIARAKHLAHDQGISEIRRSLGDELIDGPAPKPRPLAEVVGVHRLAKGMARGFALPFGHTTAGALRRFARVAAQSGASSIRPAPGRCLLAIGLPHSAADRLCKAAVEEEFVLNADDRRRQVVACAGAPACASAELPTRQLAPEVARTIRSWAGTSNIVHLSGCSKGCAHPGPAALTVTGPNRLILNGRAGDTPQATISSAGVIADIQRLCNEL